MKGILAVLFLSLVISPGFGQWHFIDDFQQWSGGGGFFYKS